MPYPCCCNNVPTVGCSFFVDDIAPESALLTIPTGLYVDSEFYECPDETSCDPIAGEFELINPGGTVTCHGYGIASCNWFISDLGITICDGVSFDEYCLAAYFAVGLYRLRLSSNSPDHWIEFMYTQATKFEIGESYSLAPTLSICNAGGNATVQF